MSRAYRLRVRESLRRTIKGSDRVSSQLELLEIVPREELAAILAGELAGRGFEEREGKLVRQSGSTEVAVDPSTGEIVVTASVEKQHEEEIEREGRYFDDRTEAQRARMAAELSAQARQELEQRAERRQESLAQQATDELDQALRDLQGELDQVVNRVTAEALKRKASRLGQIKEMTEDAENGSLTIVVEV